MALVAAVIGCTPRSDRQSRIVSDPIMLRAALSGWQEGPTDGRLCLDPLVLEPSSTRRASAFWSDTVLAVLLGDSRVALDSSRAPSRTGVRACAPTRTHPRLSLAPPVFQRETAIVESAASTPATGADSAFTLRITTRLVHDRMNSRWTVVGNHGPYGTPGLPVR